jgi:hypothetical protein
MELGCIIAKIIFHKQCSYGDQWNVTTDLPLAIYAKVMQLYIKYFIKHDTAHKNDS